MNSNITFIAQVDAGNNNKELRLLENVMGHSVIQASVESSIDILYQVVSNIQSPYVIFCDSDEYILNSGVEECMTFLNNNQEYVACTGLIGGFQFDTIQHKNFLRMFDWYSMFSEPVRLDQKDIIDRLKQVCEPFSEFGFFGGVIRTSILVQILEELKNITFSNQDVCKKYMFIRALTLGPIHYSDSFYTKFKDRYSLLKETVSWERKVLCAGWMQDFELLNDRISEVVATEQGVSKKDIDMLLRNVFYESKQRVYGTDYFQYIPLKKRFRNLNYIFDLLHRLVLKKQFALRGFLKIQKMLLSLKVYKNMKNPQKQWIEISQLVDHLTHKESLEI